MEKKIEEQFNKKFTDYPGGVYSGEKPARKEDILDFVETICQQERERIEDDLLLGKSYIVYGVIDKNQKILNDQTLFYFNKDYADSAVKLMNESVVEKNKPYRVRQFYLMSFCK